MMLAGEEYAVAITALASDRRARRAFQELVLDIASPAGCIFDFGAGTGIDAKHYAERGFRVVAYDVDPRMCAAFTRHCQPEIASGQIQLREGAYREFLELQVPAIRSQHAIDIVTANFAPFSLIDDPRELFARLHLLCAPNAKIIASVLNPDFIGDTRYGWWWANRLRYWRRGHFCVAGTPSKIFRRSLGNFTALASPYFRLEAALRALPRRPGAPLRSSGRLALTASRYIFLVFAKR